MPTVHQHGACLRVPQQERAFVQNGYPSGFVSGFCSDIAKLEAFYKTNHWYEFVTNVEVATLSQQPSINEAISRRRHSLFGHIRHMDQAALAHQALHLSVTSLQGSGQFGTWRRQPGHPRKCWVEQVTTSTELSPSDAWSVANLRRISQHGGRYDPSTVKRRQRDCGVLVPVAEGIYSSRFNRGKRKKVCARDPIFKNS